MRVPRNEYQSLDLRNRLVVCYLGKTEFLSLTLRRGGMGEFVQGGRRSAAHHSGSTAVTLLLVLRMRRVRRIEAGVGTLVSVGVGVEVNARTGTSLSGRGSERGF